MEILSPQQIRESFVNCSRSEAEELPLPPGMHEVDWGRREFLGWRDPRVPQRGYVVVPTDDKPVGILLRASEASMRSHAPSMFGWCQDVQLANDVYFWSARHAGQAGRNGDTVGTLVCGSFECTVNVRRTHPAAVRRLRRRSGDRGAHRRPRPPRPALRPGRRRRAHLRRDWRRGPASWSPRTTLGSPPCSPSSSAPRGMRWSGRATDSAHCIWG